MSEALGLHRTPLSTEKTYLMWVRSPLDKQLSESAFRDVSFRGLSLIEHPLALRFELSGKVNKPPFVYIVKLSLTNHEKL